MFRPIKPVLPKSYHNVHQPKKFQSIRHFSSGQDKMFLIFYDYVPNMGVKRGPVRPAHLSYAQASKDKGNFIAGGAFAPDIEGATIILKAPDEAFVKEWINKDPYYTSGLVTNYKVKEWTVALGLEEILGKKK